MTWWQYLMLVNIYLLLFYGFYAALLSKETFFQLNRIYLVSAAALSFFIPLIQSDWVKNLFITQQVQYTIYGSPVLLYQFKPIQDTNFTIGQLLVIVYLAGIAFLIARFALQLISLNKMLHKRQSAVAYSFFNKIKLGDANENLDVIAAHENVHAREWHSADVLIMEAIMIINWFNPIVYLYRFAIKHIHEFIADEKALKTGTTKADYALILLSQTFNAPAHQLVNPFFNKSLLKQRIMMLQKNKSQRIVLIKYCLSAPLFILMLILSSATVNNSKTIRLINKRVELVLLKPAVGNQNTNAYQLKHAGLSSVKLSKTAPVSLNDEKKQLVNVNDTTPKKDDKVFTAVEQSPKFPGGIDGFYAFLGKNIRYPKAARDNNVQGRVIISFIVEEDGELTNFNVLRGIGSGCDEEAVRVLALSPKWKPGIQNGHNVRVLYTVPISFTLTQENTTPARPAENKTGAVNENGNPANKKDSVFLGAILPRTNWNPADPNFKASPPPLLVLDGVQTDYPSGLSSVNPNDIESISILKDKNAIALYGEKAANGVIIVKTKKAKLVSPPIIPNKN